MKAFKTTITKEEFGDVMSLCYMDATSKGEEVDKKSFGMGFVYALKYIEDNTDKFALE